MLVTSEDTTYMKVQCTCTHCIWTPQRSSFNLRANAEHVMAGYMYLPGYNNWKWSILGRLGIQVHHKYMYMYM